MLEPSRSRSLIFVIKAIIAIIIIIIIINHVHGVVGVRIRLWKTQCWRNNKNYWDSSDGEFASGRL